MSRPPRPPEPIVDNKTHHSIEVSWEPYFAKLQARMTDADGRLRVELHSSRFEDSWELAYKGYDVRCVLSSLEDNVEYSIRYRFGNDHGWGEFSNPLPVRTLKKPLSGEDIHRALRRKNADDLLRVLESREASVDAPDDRGFSPLSVAAMDAELELCNLLLEHRADVNWTGENGKTCLMQVSYKGKPEVVQWLLDNGASVSMRDRKGMSALHYAADGEQLDTLRLLLTAKADPHARDNLGCTALIRCAMLKNNGNSAVAVILLGAGARVYDTDSSGQTALFHCAINRHEKMASVLLDNGADPLATNSQGVSPLKVAEAQDRKNMRNLFQDCLAKRKAEAAAVGGDSGGGGKVDAGKSGGGRSGAAARPIGKK
ncbi:hypothetical protein BOX15_Mlig025588g2 [Macrostomum lignano]|uniref:Fibronectin type-III domain-containing protein n=1 Tax=Macrostomum lignano TaxID=282301 RepID=A0A267DR77_9PLAT|nr:hypothetical protein BOX15_Mlig025588g2 [Macrostomum lignano]